LRYVTISRSSILWC